MTDAALFVLVNALFLAAGAGVCSASGWWARYRPSALSAGLAYVVGVAAYGVVAQLLYVLGAPLTRWQVAAVCLGFAATGVAAGRKHRARRVTLPRPDVGRATAAFVVGFLALVAVVLWYQPLWSYDAWVFWTPKARALVELDGLDATWFGSADLVSPDYPLLLPAVEAAGFRFTGYRTEYLDLHSWLLLVGLVAAVADLVARRAGGLLVTAALVTLVAAPTVTAQLAGAVADIPLATQFALAGVLLVVWLRERHLGALLLASVLLAGGAATKVEGLAYALAAVAGVAVAEALARRRPVLPVVVPLAAIAVAVLPWRVWLAWHDIEAQASLQRVTGADRLVSSLEHLPYVLSFVAARALDPTQWLLAVPLGLVLLADGLRRDREAAAVFALVTLVVALAAVVLAYLTTPFELEEHLRTSARRVITPLVFFLVATGPLLRDRRDLRVPAGS